jgi:nitrile hydratase
MNAVHDMGGMHGFGPVAIEENEPVFHATWEGRVFAMSQATGCLRIWNLDQSRHSQERLPPAQYLASSYYERWLASLERRLIEHQLVSPEEMRTGKARGRLNVAALKTTDVPRFLSRRSAPRENVDVAARFAVGDPVVARNSHPIGHTRLPRYARGKNGVIARDHGVHGFPDCLGMGGAAKPQHCYAVRFAARELWGADASERDSVYVDLWDDHLDPA